MLSYQPQQIAPQQATKDYTGRITGYAISYSTDGTTFTPATLKTGYDGTWQWGATQLAGWASAEFNAVTARYVRLQANSAVGDNVKINEVDVAADWSRPSQTRILLGQPCMRSAQFRFSARRDGGRRYR